MITWCKAPAKEDVEIASGSDGSSFRLDDLKGMNVSPVIARRGHTYYGENKVRYLCLDGGLGYAIAEGSEAQEVEFQYRNAAALFAPVSAAFPASMNLQPCIWVPCSALPSMARKPEASPYKA